VDRLRELRIYAKNIELQRVYYEDRQAQLEAKISQAGEAT
jgi:hypothetical protein